jgi:hypothetical protein
LEEAVDVTFENRKAKMTMDTAVFGDEFRIDSMHLSRWKALMKKKKSLGLTPMVSSTACVF